MVNEKWFAERNTLESVAAIPDFPFKDWNATREAIGGGDYEVKVSYSDANALAPLLAGDFALFFSILPNLALVTGIIVSVVWALVSHSYGMLWGIAISLVALVTGSPVAGKTCGFLSVLWCASLIVCIVATVMHRGQVAFLWGLYGAVAWCAGARYEHNANTLRDAVLQYEQVFLYALAKRVIAVTNRHTGETLTFPAMGSDSPH